MDQEREGKQSSMDSLFSAWMKSAADFWSSSMGMWRSDAEEMRVEGGEPKGQEVWQEAIRRWQTLLSSMSNPEFMETFLRGASASPESSIKITRTALEGYTTLCRQWLNKIGNLSEPVKAYQFENIDQTLFKSLRELYEKEVQPFLNIPQLGLNRSYQERLNEAIDRFTLYQTALASFLQMLSLPVEKSLRVMEEKVEELSREKKLPENFKDYYDMWIKVLEGHYMTLFKSPEYIESLSGTINAGADYKAAQQRLLFDLLQPLPIPTNKDMDELYKEIYLLKKTVRELTRKVAEH